MVKTIVFFLISLFLSAVLTYAGSDFYVALGLGGVLFAILVMNPISFQSKKERDEMMERIHKNRERIIMLQEERKKERQEANKRSRNRG